MESSDLADFGSDIQFVIRAISQKIFTHLSQKVSHFVTLVTITPKCDILNVLEKKKSEQKHLVKIS